MSNPLTTSRNKYHSNVKNSTIYTPKGICNFLFDLLHPIFKNTNKKIVDPSIGSGNLIKPFSKYGYKIIGFDIDDNCEINIEKFNKINYLEYTEKQKDISFVICNPPFNTDKRNKNYLKKNKLGKALLPELFIDKTFEIYGNNIPLIIICPMGVRLNQRIYESKNRIISERKGKRYRKIRDNWPKITSIISLPLDIFENVEFHCEILIFNIPQLDAHYVLPEKSFKEI